MMNNIQVKVVENEDYIKALKALEEEYLLKGALSIQEQNALLEDNNDIMFAQIISREFGKRCYDFTIERSKFEKDNRPALLDNGSKYNHVTNIHVSEEDIVSLENTIQNNTCEIKLIKRQKISYEKHKKIVESYCLFIGYQNEKVVKKAIISLLDSLGTKDIMFSKEDKVYITRKIVSIRESKKNQSDKDFNSFKDTFIRSICGYYN